MKLRCVRDNIACGIIKTRFEHINGLSKDKIYTAYAVPVADNVSIFNGSTNIKESDIKFLIFNDCCEWKAYDKNLFAPAE